MTTAIDTRKSRGYRKLRFESVEQCIDEVHQILAANEAGTLKATGNWTPGQIMTHLANWIEYAYIGFPIDPPPFFVRWILRLGRGRMLRGGMPRGVKIPGVQGGTVGMEQVDTPEAGRRLLAALARLQSDEEAPYPSPAFGPMSHPQRVELNLRHAELHLGYLTY